MLNIAKENIFNRMELPGSALQLALFRIFVGAQIFYAAGSKAFDLLLVVEDTQEKPTVFPVFFDELIAHYLAPYLVIVTQVFAVLLVLGLLTRYVTPLLFCSFLLLYSFYYIGANAPIQWLYFWFPLLILCFTRCADRLSLDRRLGFISEPPDINSNTYRWPIELFAGWFAYIYFAAGLAKIFPVVKGVEWIYGGTSQSIIYNRFLDSPLYYLFGQPFFDYSSHHWVFAGLSAGSLIVELMCVFIFLTWRFNLIILFLVTCMHFFLYLTGVGGFMQTALILGIALLLPTWFPDYPNKNILTESKKH